MTLQEIIDLTRLRMNNYEKPYLWQDTELVFYANEVYNQISRETKTLIDTETESVCRVFTTPGVLDYSLSPLVLYVNSVKLVKTELMTLDVAATPASFSIGSTLTGALSGKTCAVVSADSATSYTIDHRDGTFTLGEIISDGTNSADQGTSHPIFTDNSDESVLLSKSSVLVMNSMGAWRNTTADEPCSTPLPMTTMPFISLWTVTP
jgi:hypothetical protein